MSSKLTNIAGSREREREKERERKRVTSRNL